LVNSIGSIMEGVAVKRIHVDHSGLAIKLVNKEAGPMVKNTKEENMADIAGVPYFLEGGMELLQLPVGQGEMSIGEVDGGGMDGGEMEVLLLEKEGEVGPLKDALLNSLLRPGPEAVALEAGLGHQALHAIVVHAPEARSAPQQPQQPLTPLPLSTVLALVEDRCVVQRVISTLSVVVQGSGFKAKG